MFRAEEIGISIGTGLNRTRHRSDEIVDKSKPKEDTPSWWISSTWVPQESDEDKDSDDDNNDHHDNNNHHDNDGNDGSHDNDHHDI